LTDGHANLALHEVTGGVDKKTTYGTWPNKVVNKAGGDGSVSNILVNFPGDQGRRYRYVHCREISDAQYQKLQKIVADGEEWGWLNNCSNFASDTFSEVTNVNVSASDTLWISTPRELGADIMRQNGGGLTNYTGGGIPMAPANAPSSSSF
jgi:hypothetical protein